MTRKPAPPSDRAADETEAADGLRLLLIVGLIVVVGLQAFLVGWALDRAAAVSLMIERPARLMHFFELLLFILVPVVALNAGLGAYLAHKLVRPLERIRLALSEVTRGNLEHPFESQPDELLRAYTAECEKTLETLRRLLYRDRGHADEANDRLSRLNSLLEKSGRLSKEDQATAETMIAEAKSYLSLVNDHFLKGKRAAP